MAMMTPFFGNGIVAALARVLRPTLFWDYTRLFSPCLAACLAAAGAQQIMSESANTKWRLHGVRVVHSNELDVNTAQTPGMNRAAAITAARAGAEKLWAGTVVIHPNARTGAHHHGPVESVIYVVSGRARMRWGDRLEFVAEAGHG